MILLLAFPALAAPLTFPDRDGDGYGAPPLDAPAHVPRVDNRLDCDDEDPRVFPEAGEGWADGFVDNDCDDEAEPVYETLVPVRLRTPPPPPRGADLDVDGAPERIEVRDDEARVISGSAGLLLARVALGGATRARLVGDVDGDGAPDLLVLGDEARLHGGLRDWPVQGAQDAALVVIGGPFTDALDLGDRGDDGGAETLLAREEAGGAWLGVLCSHELGARIHADDLLLQAGLPEGWGASLMADGPERVIVLRADGRAAAVPAPR